MKTVFIINPCAGKKKDVDAFINKIYLVKNDVAIYETTAVGDATRFVREYIKTNGVARFIACGGDGTLNEVVNGMAEMPHCEVGVIPMGTGNDFCRNFDKECNFFNIQAQIEGDSEKCDLIRYTITDNGTQKSGYCINMFNIGFDCNVADMTNFVKKKTFFGGSVAYFIAILIMLIRKKGENLKIELDGETSHDGKLLLTSIANGCYCGGGIKSNPLAKIKDGLININIIKNISRLRFITLLPSYMNGTVLKKKGIEKFIKSVKCNKVILTPNNKNMRICIDGEITDAEKTEFSIVHNGLNFVVPKEKVREKVII